MVVERFVPMKHLPHVENWLKARGMVIEPYDLPYVGYVAKDEDTYVAVAFMRECEGNLALLEGLTSNPDLPGEQRNNGLDLVIATILSNSNQLGITKVIAWSRDVNTISRSLRHGFVVPDQTLIVKQL